MIFLAKNQGGVVGFYDDQLGPVPEQRAALSDQGYDRLLFASSRGATLAVENGQTFATDWRGTSIDLTAMSADAQYGKPPTPPSLQEQAKARLPDIQQATNMAAAMGEIFGPSMRDYVQKIRAVASGTETTSTTLPAAPADPTQ